MKIGVISGYFNPLHAGHIDYINGAKKRSDILIAIVNNDDQVKLKNTIPFMDENHRLEIVANLKSVDDTIISIDKSYSVCETIKFIRKKFPKDDLTFFNSGDRIAENIDSEERHLCVILNIDFALIFIPKRYSSSELIKEALVQLNKRRL